VITALVKFGGEVVREAATLAGVLADVARLEREGWRFVLCHGGGPQLTELQARLGQHPTMIGGRRVTDAATLQAAKQVLAGEVATDVAAAACAAGLRAVAFSGVSAGLVRARRLPPQQVRGSEEPVDYGLVGEVTAVDPRLVQHLWQGGYTPIVSPLGVDVSAVYNINADTVAVEIAAALRVDHLFLMTSVPGVLRDLRDPSSRVPNMTVSEIRRGLDDGTITGGMIPKVKDVLRHLGTSIGGAYVMAASPGALQAEVSQPGSRGTVLLPDGLGSEDR
jgi:acetylglutamate kinase